MKHPGYRLKESTYTLNMSLLLYNPLLPMKAEYAELVTASMVSRVPNDVCIHFPRTGRSLWANESVLRKASPYLSSLLTSGFSETESPSQDDNDVSSGNAPNDPFDFEDSDEESDKAPLPEPASRSNDFGVARFKRINITQATYTTYANVLCFIGSGYIAFAPLKSIQRFAANSHLFNQPERPSSVPIPASPKSIYRLAHLLELPDLTDLARQCFGSQLSPQNVAFELYTDVASIYPEIRDIAIDYAVTHWAEVSESEAYREVRNRAENGGVDSLTGMLLIEKLTAR
ncbi:hypothetical protein JCM5353_006135 [Sporobolomyces roseus]